MVSTVASLLGGCWYTSTAIRDLVDAQRIVIGLLVQESASARQHVNDLLDRVNELEVRAAGE